MTKSGLFRLGAVLLLLSLVACTHWTNDLDRIVDQSGRDFSRLPDANWVEVDLQNLMDHPTSYKLMFVRFYAILNQRHENIYVPGYLIEKEENTHNYSVWPTTARLWNEVDYVNSLPTIYINRGHPDMQKLLDSPRYSLVLIRGHVGNDFEQLPYIQTFYYDVIVPSLYDEASLASVTRGIGAADQPSEAINHLESALQGSLGAPGRLVTHLKLARHYEDRGDFQNALAHFEGALKYDPANKGAQEGVDRCLEQLERIAAIEAGVDPTPEPEPEPARKPIPRSDPPAEAKEKLVEAARLQKLAMPLYLEVANTDPLPSSEAQLRALLAKARRAERYLTDARALYASAARQASDPASVRRKVTILDELIQTIRGLGDEIRSKTDAQGRVEAGSRAVGARRSR